MLWPYPLFQLVCLVIFLTENLYGYFRVSMKIMLNLPSDATTNSGTVQDQVFDPTGWELALVTTPSSNNATAVESKLVSFFPFLSIRYDV